MKPKKNKFTKQQKGYFNSLIPLIATQEYRTVYQQVARFGRDRTIQDWHHTCKICNSKLYIDADYDQVLIENLDILYNHFAKEHQITDKDTADKYARMLAFL